MKRQFLLIALIATCTVNAQYIQGRCIRVVDGDTYMFAINNGDTIKVRDAYCNTPERKNAACKLEQPFGLAATLFAKDFLLNKMFSIRIVGYDIYGRTLAYAKVDNVLYHKAAINAGMAWANKQSGVNYRLQKKAKKRKSGLWVSENQVNPSVWLKINTTKKIL